MNFHSIDLVATFAQDADAEYFALQHKKLPRFIFLLLRLFSFGYADWMQQPGCPLPEFAKNTVRRLDDTVFCAENAPMVTATARALFAHYPVYQRWLTALPPSHPLALKNEYAKYRFLSMPIDRVKGLCKTSKANLRRHGVPSLHYMLLAYTYQEIRLNGFCTATEAARLLPQITAFKINFAVDRMDLLLPADEALEFTYDLID
ncbi:MAG: hypothetical protein MUC87_06845 [Bacteroidia bacterium]|jgi:hypothetical protein|nr:hypothetical protein [Bacteroidia bacterium]